MLTAVNASISTPVWPATLTSAVTRTPQGSRLTAKSTPALVMGSGWQRGMSSWVFLAAMMPARRAVASTSPFLAVPASSKASVAGRMATKPSARAERCVMLLAETSTMRASPLALRWVSFVMPACPPLRAARVDGGATPSRRATLNGARSWSTQQRARGGSHVRLAHQPFTHQESVHAGLGEPRQIGGAGDAALGHDDAVIGNARRQPLGGVERRLEGVEVAVVNADHAAIQAQRAVELASVVHFRDGIHIPGLGVGAQRAGGHVINRGHDDQDAVGAKRPRLGHLIAVEHEILAQHRQRRGRARLA